MVALQQKNTGNLSKKLYATIYSSVPLTGQQRILIVENNIINQKR